jgi:hypothetical protein
MSAAIKQAAHTPAPWMICQPTNGRLGLTVVFLGTEEFTATDICTIEPEDDHGEAIRVADANAALIAAAPELVGALQDLIMLAAQHRGKAMTDSVARARAALAKAGVSAGCSLPGHERPRDWFEDAARRGFADEGAA